MRRTLLVIVLGLAMGLGAGLAVGWSFPVNTVKTDPTVLSVEWQADWTLMTAQAYSLDGDLNTARQRLALLGEGDPGARVAQRGEQGIRSRGGRCAFAKAFGGTPSPVAIGGPEY